MRADALRNRERILDAARQVFREKGYDNASLDEIAKRAGVGPGTLYRHFPTREVLYDAAIQAWAETVGAAVDEALAGEGTPHDRLMAWFRAHVAMLTKNKGAAARITSSLGDEGSPFAAKCRTYLNANDRVLEALRAEGVVRDGVDPMQLTRLVGGVAVVVDNSELDADVAHAMLEVIANGVLRPA